MLASSCHPSSQRKELPPSTSTPTPESHCTAKTQAHMHTHSRGPCQLGLLQAPLLATGSPVAQPNLQERNRPGPTGTHMMDSHWLFSSSFRELESPMGRGGRIVTSTTCIGLDWSASLLASLGILLIKALGVKRLGQRGCQEPHVRLWGSTLPPCFHGFPSGKSVEGSHGSLASRKGKCACAGG